MANNFLELMKEGQAREDENRRLALQIAMQIWSRNNPAPMSEYETAQLQRQRENDEATKGFQQQTLQNNQQKLLADLFSDPTGAFRPSEAQYSPMNPGGIGPSGRLQPLNIGGQNIDILPVGQRPGQPNLDPTKLGPLGDLLTNKSPFPLNSASELPGLFSAVQKSNPVDIAPYRAELYNTIDSLFKGDPKKAEWHKMQINSYLNQPEPDYDKAAQVAQNVIQEQTKFEMDNSPEGIAASARRQAAEASAVRGQLWVTKEGTLKWVRPGEQVPKDATSPARYGNEQGLTTVTRSMIEAAPKVLGLAKRAEALIDQQVASLGPAASRWNEFMTGKVGAPNPEFMKLRTDITLLTTQLMRMHVGARGGVYFMEHFNDLMNVSKQSPENLKAALEEIVSYANDIQAMAKGSKEQDLGALIDEVINSGETPNGQQ